MRPKTRNVLVLLSEILSAKTLAPLVERLADVPDIELRVINDGFCVDFIRTLGIPFELIDQDFADRVRPLIAWADLVLMGKSYVEPAEYDILRIAKEMDRPVLIAIPDMGLDIVRAKLRGIGDEIPWPLLLLADPRTKDSLVASGVPGAKIIEAGNPYFDDLYRDLVGDRCDQSAEGIGYLSTPFCLDYSRGVLPANYPHALLIDDLKVACEELGVPLVAKLHPQVNPELFEGVEIRDGSPLEFIRQIRVAVGCYSTTLLEAYVAGVPTISYQPWDADIRGDVFEGRIPIVKTREDLVSSLGAALHEERKVEPGRAITYFPGASLNRFVEVVLMVLNNPPGARSTLPLDADSRRDFHVSRPEDHLLSTWNVH